MTSAMNEMLDFYEDQHRNLANRVVHHVAHLIAVVGLGVLFSNPLLGLAMIIAALPLSWFGHFAFERNVPAFFDTTERGGMKSGVGKSLVIAVGGVMWSAACAGRVIGIGPLVK